MLNVDIRTEDADDHTVTLLTLSRRVPDDYFFDVLTSLVTTQAADVKLTDGRTAVVRLLIPGSDHRPLSGVDLQRSLPLREYYADAQLMFELPGCVRCRAATDEEARQLITDVICHQRPGTAGFRNGDRHR
jgi:hypothetical protein